MHLVYILTGYELIFNVIPEFVKFFNLWDDLQKYLGGHLAPSSHCSILIVTPLVSKAIQENNLSIAPNQLAHSKI